MTDKIAAFLAEQKRIHEAADPEPWVGNVTAQEEMMQILVPVWEDGEPRESRWPAIDHDASFMWSVHGRANYEFVLSARSSHPVLVKMLEDVLHLVAQHRSVEQHNEMVPITGVGDLIREPSSEDYLRAITATLEGEDTNE